MRVCQLFLLSLGCCLLAFRLSAQPVSRQAFVQLVSGADQISLKNRLAYFRDSLRVRTIADICRLADSAAFQTVRSPVPNFGVVSGLEMAIPIWLRFRIHNPGNHTQTWFAELDFWCYDELEFFVVDAQNKVVSTSPTVGWKTPSAKRIRHHRHFWFPFTIASQQTVTAYLRIVKQRGSQVVPIKLVSESAYESSSQWSYLFWGGVLFTLLFVALMSLIFFLTSFDRVYAKYIFCLLGLAGFFFINNGFLNQFAFKAQFWMPRQNAYFLFPLVLFYSQLFFVRSFLNLRNTPARHWHTIGTAVLWGGALCLVTLTIEWFMVLTPTIELVLTRSFTAFYWLPLPVIVAYIVVSIVRRYHVREAWLYLIAIFPFYALNFGLILANFHLLPTFEPFVDFTYYASAGLFEVLVLTVGLAYRYKAIRDQTEMLIKENIIQQKQTYEADVQTLALRNRLLLEKERIARDLHDNVGAHLAFIVSNLSHISDQIEKKASTEMNAFVSRLRSIVVHTQEASKLLRETIWAIHQENFTVAEFDDRINQYINRYFHQENHLEIDVQVTGSQVQRLSSTQVLNLFRIIQEALNNVVKHAQATTAQVYLRISEQGGIILRIQDNGRGFLWPGTTISTRHYGLNNMQTRAEELGGSFHIAADNGTTIEVII